jgi:hypothetical protein
MGSNTTLVPYVLSTWAIFKDRELATRVSGEIDDEALGKYTSNAQQLRERGLEECVETMWQVIPDLARNVMIIMSLTRSNKRIGITRPVPTVEQGRYLIHLDSRLSQPEKNFVQEYLPNARDKNNDRLFSRS